MDFLTIAAWATLAAMVAAFIRIQSGGPLAPMPESEPSSGMLALEAALALFSIGLIFAGIAAILCQWIVVVAYAARKGYWIWLAACLLFNLVGSTIAYLSLRRRWDPNW